MKFNYKFLLPFFLFFYFPYLSFAQNYEIIGEFEQRIEMNSFPSIYYMEQDKVLSVRVNAIRRGDFWVDFKKGGKVQETEYTKLGDGYEGEKYKRIGINKFSKKDSIIYIFKQKTNRNLFYFSYQEELEGDKSWQIDISSLTDIQIDDEVVYRTKLITDYLLAITVFGVENDSTLYWLLVDIKNEKAINFFSTKTKTDFSSLSDILNNLTTKGDYVLYQEYKHERFSKKEAKKYGKNHSEEIGKHIQTFYIRKIGTDEVESYQVDQSNYFVGKSQAYLSEDGTLQIVGLYSKLPQARLLFRHMFSFESTNTNDVRGIFVQTFKNGQKISDEKIPLTTDIIKKAKTESNGTIALAILVPAPLKKEENKTTLMTLEVTLYSGNQQRKPQYEKITVCIDQNSKITWWDLLHIGRGENDVALIKLETNEEKQNDEKYTTLVVNSDRIEAYKAVCGATSNKKFEIPSTIKRYKYVTMQPFMNEENDVYALYSRGKKHILVKLNTGKTFKEILD
ncbi:hypothetical protein WAF17_13245 [Bernardetia sp. ABR2-2B]|uniref:hypothetical protein n=1 Tax=Bernardetia sp. ABR2-2B TaxID=3127472 RepID=UPI0030D59630